MEGPQRSFFMGHRLVNAVVFALVLGAASLVFMIVRYESINHFIRWRIFWFRRRSGFRPFPNDEDERRAAADIIRRDLLRFIKWVFDYDRELFEMREAYEKATRDFDDSPESRSKVQKARNALHFALAAYFVADRDVQAFEELLYDMDALPHDFESPELFKERHRPPIAKRINAA